MSNQSYLATWALQLKRLEVVFIFGSMLLLFACGGDSGSPSGGATLSCNTTSYSSGTYFSFADFNKVLGNCGTAYGLNYTYFAGKSFHMDSDTGVYTFDTPSTVPTAASPANGTYVDSAVSSNIAFKWYVKEATDPNASGYSYLVLKGTDTSAGADIRLSIAVNVTNSGTPGSVNSTYDIRAYVEQSNYATENPMVRESGTDGVIADHIMTQDTSGSIATITCPVQGSPQQLC